MAPPSLAAYRPPPPRPPREPERPWWRTPGGWMTAAGWGVLVVGGVLFALYLVRWSSAADRRATEEAEVARESKQLDRVNTWIQDTSSTIPVPQSAGPPPQASVRAKRMWVASRMLVDGRVWEREIMERHGAARDEPPAAWGTPRYWADARDYPEVGTYLDGRVAAIAEIGKSSSAWVEERTAALARESGLPAPEIRDNFPRDFGAGALDVAPMTEAMLQFHRHLVRVDPRVHHVGGNELRYEREDDVRRTEELLDRLNAATVSARQARRSRLTREFSAPKRWIQ